MRKRKKRLIKVFYNYPCFYIIKTRDRKKDIKKIVDKINCKISDCPTDDLIEEMDTFEFMFDTVDGELIKLEFSRVTETYYI